MKKRLAALLALCMMMCAAGAMAAAVTYVERGWNGTAVTETVKSTGTYTTVAAGTTAWSNGWYVVEENVSIGDRISVSGTVNLILCDGATLKAEDGIHVGSGNTLNIYAQENGTGSLTATATMFQDAGIGGGDGGDGGTVTVYGGTVEATGGYYGAGIGGGGNGGDGGTVTIYGGTVNVGGTNGAGIGGGISGNGGTVTVYGGTVEATSGYYGAGIGGGDNGDGGTVTVYGGTVTATGSNYGAGIGGGDNGDGGTVTVYGGTVTATGGNSGAGIGGGGRFGAGGTVTINGGTVTAQSTGVAAIGGGSYNVSQGTLAVNGSVVKMLGGESESDTNKVDVTDAQDFLNKDLKYGYAYIEMATPEVESGSEPGVAAGAAAADLPRTGDASMLGAWAALLGASYAGLKLRRKK